MTKSTQAKTGRPSRYSRELTEKICRRIAEGEPLVKICRDKGMPNYVTVLRWRHGHDDFRQMYVRAREDAADTLVDEILEIADQAEQASSSEQVQAARLRVDTRKWAASKMKPKAYGDKLQHTGDGGGPITVGIEAALTAALTRARDHERKIQGDEAEGEQAGD